MAQGAPATISSWDQEYPVVGVGLGHTPQSAWDAYQVSQEAAACPAGVMGDTGLGGTAPGSVFLGAMRLFNSD